MTAPNDTSELGGAVVLPLFDDEVEPAPLDDDWAPRRASGLLVLTEADLAPRTPRVEPRPPMPAHDDAAVIGIGIADLVSDPPDPALFQRGEIGHAADPALLLELRILPWQRIAGQVIWVSDAIGRLDSVAEVLRSHGLSPGEVLFAHADTPEFERAFAASYGRRLAARAARAVPASESVRGLRTHRRAIFVTLAVGLSVAMLTPEAAALSIFATVFAVNSLTALLRLVAFAASFGVKRHDAEALRSLPRQDHDPSWPTISVLVPLHREAEMVPRLIAALDRIDYPEHALEVLLVAEETDRATIRALETVPMPLSMRMVVVPDGGPKTKPRALNYAMGYARGEIVGILDAEDRPEPGQLRAVAGALRTLPDRVAAVQCQLVYFNARENWITRCFQLEYAIWFDVLLRGFERLGLPLPLGGTSVYFRREALAEVGGWDAHNVTEDADLGMRLFRHGYRVKVLSAATEEEANCRPLPWIRQRSRWLKGYLLTWLSHARAPFRLWREMGTRGFLGFNILFLGAACAYLAMPLFWVSVIGWTVAGVTPWDSFVPGWAVWPLGISLGGGQALMLAAATLAMWRKRALDLLIWVPTLPLYWTLGALAAWKAVIELFVAPYYWDKTKHGVTRMMPLAGRTRSKALRHAGIAPYPDARFSARPPA
ncbi:MAG: glycosyltransferase family 2 protein [Pseudomonadota bacterium]